MTRLKFRFTPRDTADFDVCSGPPRPARAEAGRTPETEPAVAPPPARHGYPPAPRGDARAAAGCYRPA